jgi:hypothetical protein
VSDLIPEQLDDWDNNALGSTAKDAKSFDDCVETCKNDKKCLQAQWKGDECVIGTEHVMLGQKHLDGDENKRYRSFWKKDRIAQWAEKHKCHDGIKFPFEDGKNP